MIEPTPFPPPERTNLQPPDRDEVEFLTRGVISAISPSTGPTELQYLLIEAAFEALTGHGVSAADVEPIGPAELARGMADRNEAFRTRILQTMILGALVLRPLEPEVADRIEAFARAMSVDDGMLTVARRFAEGQLGMAAVDFERNGYASMDAYPN